MRRVTDVRRRADLFDALMDDLARRLREGKVA